MSANRVDLPFRWLQRSRTGEQVAASPARQGLAKSIATTLILGFSATITFSAEPVTAVAMVRPTAKKLVSTEATKAAPRTEPVAFRIETNSTNRPAPVIDPEKFASVELRLSPPVEPDRGSSLIQVSRRSPSGEGTLKGWGSARLEAGYGTPLDDLPIPLHGRNGTAWEEPSYGYFMVRFAF